MCELSLLIRICQIAFQKDGACYITPTSSWMMRVPILLWPYLHQVLSF